MEKKESFQATEEIISDGEIQGKRNLISAEFFLNAKQRKAFFVLKISINFCRDFFFFSGINYFPLLLAVTIPFRSCRYIWSLFLSDLFICCCFSLLTFKKNYPIAHKKHSRKFSNGALHPQLCSSCVSFSLQTKTR